MDSSQPTGGGRPISAKVTSRSGPDYFLMWPITALINEFRRGWQGISRPSLAFSVGFSVACLALATAARWVLALLRPDVYFTPYFPAVFFATALGGYRTGMATAVAASGLGLAINFGDVPPHFFPRLVLLAIFAIVSGLTTWGAETYRSVAPNKGEISGKLIRE